MFPAAACHEVSAPAVAQFMGNNIDVLPVPADDGRGSKCKDGILHAYVSALALVMPSLS